MSRPAEPQTQFDEHAADYEARLMRGLSLSGETPEFFARGRVTLVRRWWTRTARAEPRRIVDYGCGVGLACPLLARLFPQARVLGLDPSQQSVERATKRWTADRVRFELLSRSSSDHAPADLVYLNGVVHHVVPEERPALFRDLAARLAPGGIVALFDNNPWNPGTRWVMARIAFDRDAVLVRASEARRSLRDAGLAPLSTDYLFYFPRWLAALRPVEGLLGRVPLGAQYGILATAG